MRLLKPPDSTPRTTKTPRSPMQRELDRMRLSRWLAQKVPQNEIALRLGLSESTIIEDKKVITKRWQQEASKSIEIIVAAELQTLLEVEREAWEAWFRSNAEKKKELRENRVNSGGEDELIQRTQTENTYGDPRYLEIILNASAARRKLIGADAPARLDIKAMIYSEARLIAAEFNMSPEDLVSDVEQILLRKGEYAVSSS